MATKDFPERRVRFNEENEGSAAAITSMPRRPEFLEQYDLLECIGQGGQGEIWKVWDFDLLRFVAMKRLNLRALESSVAVYRFVAEAQVASQLEHPGILPILDLGLDPDGRPFYTTQLLPGTTLADIWRQVHSDSPSEWTTNRAVDLLVRICDVLAHAHSRGVIHHDLKPSNVLVGAFGDVRVIDWGSAHVCEEGSGAFSEAFLTANRAAIGTDRTRATGAALGSFGVTAVGQPITTLFMPPEILRDGTQLPSPQTDIYSMGVMLYELLTRRLPYAQADGSLPERAEQLKRILAGAPRPVRLLQRSVSRDLAAICHKAMAYAARDRYATMAALGRDLRAALEIQPVQARDPGLWLRFQKWAQRNAAWVSVGVIVILLASSAFALVRGIQADRDVARQLTALRSAELASHNGNWRGALRFWNEAESAGYNDALTLGLRRAEAWTVLGSPARAHREMDKVGRQSDYGDRRGLVLLRTGEYDLYEGTTVERGIKRIREALDAGLEEADKYFACGLLADSTVEALKLFQQARQFDPYHHAAHRHSLALEYLLGRKEFESHGQLFKILFPDDPSAEILRAMDLALQARPREAAACLAQLSLEIDPNLRVQLTRAFQIVPEVTEACRIERVLAHPELEADRIETIVNALAQLPLTELLPASKKHRPRFHIPRLPCLSRYVDEKTKVSAFFWPGSTDPERLVQTIKATWRRHPEGSLPISAAWLLEKWQPSDAPKIEALQALQAELYQLAAESPSLIPTLGRYARYYAVKTWFELARGTSDRAASGREACLRNLRQVLRAEDLSIPEAHAYFDMAMDLNECEVARVALQSWEHRQPSDVELSRCAIRLETAVGAYGSALDRIDRFLADHPGDSWAGQQRSAVVIKLNQLLKTLPDFYNR